MSTLIEPLRQFPYGGVYSDSPSTSAADTPKDAIVLFAGVQKTYDGETLVVHSLDLEIFRGEFLSLLGPSGSGKTTILMMLAGFESPTAGDISLNGNPITRVPPHKRNFGMVFQNYALFPHMTVAQNVAYPLMVRRTSKSEIERRVSDALAMVKLVGKDDSYPSQLSGGQQQRVALARAMVFKPQLVLMDEPLGALDKQLREHMQIELKELHRKMGVTFVYVTHDQSEALTMSDRVAVFNDGKVQQIDVVSSLYETPSNRFVAEFVGDSTTLHGKVYERDGDNCNLVLPTGEHLHGQNVNAVAVGNLGMASIRPERIVAHFDDSTSFQNTIRSTVTDIIYFGDHLRLRCAVAGQAEATVKLLPDDAKHLHTGMSVWLTFPPAYLRVYS